MKHKLIYSFLLVVLCLCLYFFHLIYSGAKKRAIAELNQRQMIHARQAQTGIESYFNTITQFLTQLSLSKHIVDMDEQGKQELDFALLIQSESIKAITRMNAHGRIVHTTPLIDPQSIGRDISDLAHVQKILKTHSPVASEVFTAAQGFRTVALHVPVFESNEFRGTLAVLIDFMAISKRFLEGIRLGETGYAWMISQAGIELYCPVPGYTGNSVFVNRKAFPTILAMAEEMVKGKQGETTYTFDRIGDQQVEPTKKHAVYRPIKVVDNFWTIVVASSETEVLASLVDFKNKLMVVVGLLVVGSGIFSFYSMRAWGIVREAAEKKKMEETLRQSEEKYRLLVENQSDLIVKIDPQGRLLFVSSSYCDMFGKSERELIGKKFMPLVHEEDREATAREMEKLFAPPHCAYVEQRAMTPDGLRWLGWQDTALLDENQQVKAIIGVGRDITARKKYEIELQKTRALLETAINQSPSGILIADAPHVRIRYANPAAFHIRGGPTELLTDIEVEQHSARWQTFYPDSTPYDPRDLPLSRAVLKGEFSKDVEVKIRHDSGEERWVSANAAPIRDAKGVLQAGIVIFYDITDRIRAEAALRESEERFRTLVEKSPLGISLIRNDGRYQYINPQFTQIFGYTLDDIPTGAIWFKKSFPDRDYRQKVVRSWIEDKKKTAIGRTRPRTFTVTCKDGSRKEIYFLPVTMENMDQFVIYEDITEQSKMEQQLQQAQKFEAIGTLAGGIAHDFNNLMMGIQGHASLMALELGVSHTQQEHLKAIEECVRSASDLTRRLLGFARSGKYVVKPLDVNDLLVKSAAMFSRTRKEIQIRTTTHPDPLVVEADNSQIEQVLLNMFINAWQAMPSGGELYLKTRGVAMEESFCSLHQIQPGQFAHITITDTGIGMDEATRQRIFDPFFTTKEKGRGTGLGLASAYGIIKNHGGAITVYSEPGYGATFNIYLPLSAKTVPEEKATTTEAIWKGSETILLVDDEAMIIEVGKAMLEKIGYRVIIARDGKAALAELRERGSQIDLVILDMIMPEMDGEHTFTRIREMLPRLPVILSSGYSINGQASKIMDRGCNGFIQKPFSLTVLSRKLREVLGNTPQGG